MQSAGMAALVNAHQGGPYVFPSLEIALRPFDELQPSLARVRAGDVLVFVSLNAVTAVYNEISNTIRCQLASAQIAAIGERTQVALEVENLFVAISPEHGHQNSEGLLNHPLLQDLTGRHVYIVRGQSGRETLRETLLERGAQLDYISAYSCSVPREYEITPVIEAFAAGQIQYVMLTSFAAFENLYQMFGIAADSILESAQLVVAGTRVAQKIRDSYPFCVRTAKNASNKEMLAAIG